MSLKISKDTSPKSYIDLHDCTGSYQVRSEQIQPISSRLKIFEIEDFQVTLRQMAKRGGNYAGRN